MSSFGVATIEGPQGMKSRARKMDCGRHGRLTAAQIARTAGITESRVWQRVRIGWKGEELCRPKHDSLRGVKTRCSKPVVRIAMKLARTFPDKVPTLAEIRRAHPMCERNAMRWRQAMQDAQA